MESSLLPTPGVPTVSSTPAAKSLPTPEPRIYVTRTKTHTPQDSGQSTAASSALPETGTGDPYGPLCEALHALLARKRGYYGCAQDPLENALGVEEMGVEAWLYQAARIGEKIRRLRGPLGALDREKTLMDIAGHALVAIACERRKGAQNG